MKTPIRLPAQQLEQAVLQGLIAFLNDEGRVLEAIGADRPEEVMSGVKQAKALGTLGDSAVAAAPQIDAKPL